VLSQHGIVILFAATMEIVQNHVNDILHVTPLSKNYMVHFLCITAALEKSILNRIPKRNGMKPDP
jgi:hypothetical protein